MWKKVTTEFKVIVKTIEDENYDFKIQKCIEILLEKVIEKERNF
jgi:hypothetical protein